MPSIRDCRRWKRIGLKGRMKAIRQHETGCRYKAPRRTKRWTWAYR